MFGIFQRLRLDFDQIVLFYSATITFRLHFTKKVSFHSSFHCKTCLWRGFFEMQEVFFFLFWWTQGGLVFGLVYLYSLEVLFILLLELMCFPSPILLLIFDLPLAYCLIDWFLIASRSLQCHYSLAGVSLSYVHTSWRSDSDVLLFLFLSLFLLLLIFLLLLCGMSASIQ
jgi:hypothetical protein